MRRGISRYLQLTQGWLSIHWPKLLQVLGHELPQTLHNFAWNTRNKGLQLVHKFGRKLCCVIYLSWRAQGLQCGESQASPCKAWTGYGERRCSEANAHAWCVVVP